MAAYKTGGPLALLFGGLYFLAAVGAAFLITTVLEYLHHSAFAGGGGSSSLPDAIAFLIFGLCLVWGAVRAWSAFTGPAHPDERR
jgi:hypothetical protein